MREGRSPVGRPFSELVQQRVRREPGFASLLLQEAAECLLSGEIGVARSLIRDVIKGTLGYAELSRRTGTPEKSLVRMFGPGGNPTIANLGNVLCELQRHGKLRLRVTSEPLPARRVAKKRDPAAGRPA